MARSIFKFVIITSILFYTLCLSAHAEDAQTINSNFIYMLKGQPTNGWSIQLGDPENWSTSVTNRKGQSAGGKLSVEPYDYNDKGDALKLSWASSKELKGVFALYGSQIDFSAYENLVAIVFDIKIDVMPNKEVTVGMDCGYPCRAELPIRATLKKLPKETWTQLPIPLNCFSTKGLDLKKVNGPVVISTDGKMIIEITNIRMQKLAEGDKGCAK